jgi:hypothetical protein
VGLLPSRIERAVYFLPVVRLNVGKTGVGDPDANQCFGSRRVDLDSESVVPESGPVGSDFRIC